MNLSITSVSGEMLLADFFFATVAKIVAKHID